MPAYYQLWTSDERDNNWITRVDNLHGGPAVYWAYLDMLCPKCRSIDTKALFSRRGGLEGGPKIRVSKKREFAHSSEGFLCATTRVVKLLKRHRVAGFVSYLVPYTDWCVLRFITKVRFKEFKPKWDGGPCKKCGRAPYYGIVEALRHIELPKHENTFFTPDLERGASQDVFLTEKVVALLKSEGVRGAALHRLLNDEEYALALQDTPAARKKIKNRYIWLT